MNLLLLEEADFIAADRVVLRDRRLVHMQDVHRATVGDNLRVGRIGGLMGNAQVLRLEAHEAELQVAFDLPPPAKLPLTLLLALPRPKMLRRVLQTVAAMAQAGADYISVGALTHSAPAANLSLDLSAERGRRGRSR